MIPKNSYAAAAVQISTHPVEVDKIEWRSGDSFPNGTCWLQVWDSATDATNPKAVLLKSYPIYGATGYDYKEFKRGDMTFSMGCWIGVSTTESTYTAGNGTTQIWAMLSVELLRPEVPTGSTYVGDLTTAVTGLQVWSEATGAATPLNLISLEVDGTNLTGGGIQYVQIFAKDTVNTGDYPIRSIPIASGGTALVSNGITIPSVMTGQSALRFGPRGLDVLSADKPNPAITYHGGCTVKISSTASTYTACTGTAVIKAEYNTSQI